ncbi:Protein FAM207A [Chionoecetes opilio]|uniref:Protein FAM207A n=1 Tax=Chionoecetes opilio TaxID=41210 RepID=A0A8J4Y4N6_CHIOP|nr:Protein FAM207A [Chionoecetes opilio]
MGKVRKLRQKYHASLVKERAAKSSTGQNTTSIAPRLVPQVEGAAGDQTNRNNIFAGLQIKLQTVPEVTTKCVDSDSLSVVSGGQQSQVDTKIGKRKRRREDLLKKIDVVRAGQRAEKDRKKREKTVVTGDMNPLLDALPSLTELMAANTKDSTKPKKPRGTPKLKVVKKEILSDIQMFTSIHRDPQFSRDPFRAVALAVENRVLSEEN